MILHEREAILQAGPQQVGGKAWNLARLAQYGFNVPELVAIDVSAYRQWLEGSGFKTALLAARPEELAGVCASLAQVPTGLDLPALPEGPLAVRSSAPQEDSANASFAGIHTSLLNVAHHEVEEAVRKVWLSLWTPAAVAYRVRIGLPHAEAAMAVVILPLIDARVSGIVFTRDPISGRDDRMVIHATHGLGESLVSGQTEGDEILIGEDCSDDHLYLLQYTHGDKQVCIVPAPGGGTEARPGESRPALSEALALQLAEQLRLAAIALDYTRPDYDMEWAWDGEQFWLLQARPITAANRCTYPALRAQPDIWTRGNTRDVVPDPLSPIDWGTSRRLVNAILEVGFGLSGLQLHPGVQRAGLFHGRLYLNLSLMQWEGYATMGLPPEAINRLVGGHQPEISLPPPSRRLRLAHAINVLRFMLKSPGWRKGGQREVEEVMARMAGRRHEPLPQTDAAFASALRQLSRESRGARGLHLLQGSGGGTLNFLVEMIDLHLPGEGHALAAALMAGDPPSVTAQQGYELIAIARQAVADPYTHDWLQRRKSGDASDWQALPQDNALRIAFSRFLERYGHRGVYETYTRTPCWREQPDYLLDSMLELAETDLETLAKRRHAAAVAARKRVQQALPWWKRVFLSGLIRDAKAGSNEREAARSAIVAILEVVRQTLLALGGRWVAKGWLSSADEILFLLQTEIYAVLDGVLPGESLARRVEVRRRQFDTDMAEEAPDVILLQADGSSTQQQAFGDTVTGADGFHGVPAAAGVARGAARVLHSPNEGERLQRGEILVVPSTDPAWTPLFLKAGGLVMETGGYLSHGAIVAREFGIPAVVNLPGILQQIGDGDALEVDGTRGVVRRLEYEIKKLC
jgi:rifampicin phosphotransferase